MPDEQDPEANGADIPPLGLGWPERLAASVIGLAGVTAGGFGVFVSGNQAGTTAILLLGAVFLLMGVQGTAIVKASKDSVELERRRTARELTSKAEDALERNAIDQAEAYVEAVRTVEPLAVADPRFRLLSASVYEQKVIEALAQAVEIVGRGRLQLMPGIRTASHWFDATISDRENPGRAIVVEIKAVSRERFAPNVLVQQLLEQVKAAKLPCLLLITPDHQLSASAIHQLETATDAGVTVRTVRWRDQDDQPTLISAISDLVSAQDSHSADG
jgi:hypothetical protein